MHHFLSFLIIFDQKVPKAPKNTIFDQKPILFEIENLTYLATL
ncbi:MAG: hypothetical protein CM15mP121_1580 [Bacteroidota bacterium]|nr:MAG: hypothetical protein CM15mP121_1580 [Bacteroidota bacterium]